jgi:serine/threonine-protein kinase
VKRIGKYIVRGLLGRGGMSKIYQVEIPRIGKIVALKLLDPDPLVTRLMGPHQIRDLFLSEAVKLARLNHPNIVAIRDFEEADGCVFYIMDYFFSSIGQLIGEPRRTEEPSRTIRLDRAIDLTRQVLAGLACLHHHGLVHRDIKPFNLLLDDQNGVKICDFGLSKQRGERIDAPPHLKVGSPGYAAPEQEIDPENADARADLYAVGVTLYRMLTGMLPSDPPQPPAALNTDLDASWNRFILRALSRDPAGRFSDAQQMAEALTALERDWTARQARVCSLPDALPDPAPPRAQPAALRSAPLKIDSARARKEFGVNELGRPLVYARNRFATLPDGTVHDASCGLTWQQSGSPYPLSWREAHEYVAGLNRERLAAHDRWRLPTISELMTVLTPPPRGRGFCIEPVFDLRQKALWSSDRRSFTAAWFVNIEMGFVGALDFSAGCYARAVCRRITPGPGGPGPCPAAGPSGSAPESPTGPGSPGPS